MDKYIVPSKDIDCFAICESIKKKAWIVIPKCIDIKIIEDIAYREGFGESAKVCYWDNLPQNEKYIALYADLILQEVLKDNCSAMFMTGV